MATGCSSLDVNINSPNTPSIVVSQVIASYSMSTTSTNDTLIPTIEYACARLWPLCFRHSIGSPSLATSSNSFKPFERDTAVTNTDQDIINTLRHCPDQSNQSANDEISVSILLETIARRSALSTRDTNAAFGEDEVHRFFEECLHEVDGNDNPAPANQVSFKDLEAFIVEIKESFNCAPKKEKNIIIQGDLDRFWPVLFRQTLNVREHDIKVRFAGETAADYGGPLREILTLAMQRFCDISSIVTGNQNSVHFKMIPDRIVKNHYNLLGQLVGLSILDIGRGPESFNQLIFQSIYKIPCDEELLEIEDSD